MRLEKYFEVLLETAKNRVDTWDDVHERMARIAGLVREFDGDLSPIHRAAAAVAEEQIRDMVAQKEEQARAWLRERRIMFSERRDLDVLEQSLRTPPVFLSEQDLPDLVTLRREVSQELDKDIVKRVEVLFRKIKDSLKRKECLQRLASLLGEDLP